MPRRPTAVTQADIARALRAAKQAGAAEVEVRIGDAVIAVKLSTGELEPKREVIL
jgi:hypothetical protein